MKSATNALLVYLMFVIIELYVGPRRGPSYPGAGPPCRSPQRRDGSRDRVSGVRVPRCSSQVVSPFIETP